ncbi:MAG: alpha/beta fold hydrolase [Gammaproteobacteria bacterium]|nr:alpha/beta fold hydrolase [Gammaproteobacteria bacterium]
MSRKARRKPASRRTRPPRRYANNAASARRRRAPVPASGGREAHGSGEAVYLRSLPKLLNTQVADSIDRSLDAVLAHYTGGLSPVGVYLAYVDWLAHLAMAPGRRARLIEKALRKAARLNAYIAKCASGGSPEPCIEPLTEDPRFRHPGWQRWPFNVFYQTFLLNQQWWFNATTEVRGVSRQHEDIVSFATRQILDMYSPSNFIWTNPEVLETTFNEAGQNLVRGWRHWMEDWEHISSSRKPAGTESFEVGKNLAVTPGRVVFRNDLIELIQYAPASGKVYAEPVLVVPAWIMKYYILDLSPHNSLIKYLVDQGHTVFAISWKNPTSEDSDLGMDDYRESGVMAALEVIEAIVPDRKVHCVGYCLGGTLLTIAAAAMARDDDDRIKTLTLLAAQTDFTEAGELMLFINQSQLTLLEDMMWNQGFLDTHQMSGAFQILRSNDLIWSRLVRDYLLGQRQPMIDLMAWNADATRMPYRMHSEYLRRLFLDNELAAGHYTVDGRPVAIGDIRAPMFCVAATRDHVAPWRSVYKIHLLNDADEVTFLLASGGHNAGIVSEPGHANRSYQVTTRSDADRYIDPETWLTQTPKHEGSWWSVWQEWLVERSTNQVAPPAMGAADEGFPPLCHAPGEYVLLP